MRFMHAVSPILVNQWGSPLYSQLCIITSQKRKSKEKYQNIKIFIYVYSAPYGVQ